MMPSGLPEAALASGRLRPEGHQLGARVSALVRKITIGVGKPFAEGVSQPLQHVDQPSTIGAEEVAIQYYGDPSGMSLAATSVVAPRVDRTQKSELLRPGAHVGRVMLQRSRSRTSSSRSVKRASGTASSLSRGIGSPLLSDKP
jgi:hypothetical protein